MTNMFVEQSKFDRCVRTRKNKNGASTSSSGTGIPTEKPKILGCNDVDAMLIGKGWRRGGSSDYIIGLM